MGCGGDPSLPSATPLVGLMVSLSNHGAGRTDAATWCHALVVRQAHHEGCCWYVPKGLLAIPTKRAAGAARWVPDRRCAAAGMTPGGGESVEMGASGRHQGRRQREARVR